MHSGPLLRNSQLSIRRLFVALRAQTHPLSSWSGPTGGQNSGDAKGREPGIGGLKSLRYLSSGVVIFGSGLGFCYWSLFNSSSETTSSFVVLADQGIDAYEQKYAEFPDPLPEKKPKFLFKDEYRKRVFFNYEKRIRLRSPPEKVFEYFASIKRERGEAYMTPGDLMRAVVPVFPPSESEYVRGGYLMGEHPPGHLHCSPSHFFMLFDTNNDGLISFAEYIFLVTLLSIPESSFSVAFKMFDLDHNGEIDREEFKKVMALMRTYNRQGRQHRGGRRTGLKVTGSVENGGLIEYFFGKDGRESLQHDKFVQFLRDLHDEILRLEFAHYDHKLRGTISAKDFALSMVASADISHSSKFLDRVDELSHDPHLKHIRITFEEFRSFADLRRSLRPLSLAIFSHGKANDGLLTREDFQRAASLVCGIALTKNVVDIIFHVFDMNRDGSLSSGEFLRVLQRREGDAASAALPKDGAGFRALLTCWLECTSSCSSAKLLL